jgi:hypothetical protein
MNYTEIYNKVYIELKTDDLSHKDVHKSTIAICEAISDLWIISQKQNPSILNVITDIVNDLYLGDLEIKDHNS